jgi:hypothetical protein
MSAADERSLIEALTHNQKVSGGQTLETRMADLAVWFNHHRRQIPTENVVKRAEFYEKAFWVQMEINALLLERMRKMRPGGELWLPSGMLMDNQREFA